MKFTTDMFMDEFQKFAAFSDGDPGGVLWGLTSTLCWIYFNEFSSNIPSKTTFDKGHGRIEKREYQLLTDLSWLEQKDEWKGLHALGCAKSTIIESGETHEFTKYFITTLTDLNEFASAVRKHWAIENQLHWCLDVIFREDASREKKTIFRWISIFCVKLHCILFLKHNISESVKNVSCSELLLNLLFFLTSFLIPLPFLLKSKCCCRAALFVPYWLLFGNVV